MNKRGRIRLFVLAMTLIFSVISCSLTGKVTPAGSDDPGAEPQAAEATNASAGESANSDGSVYDQTLEMHPVDQTLKQPEIWQPQLQPLSSQALTGANQHIEIDQLLGIDVPAGISGSELPALVVSSITNEAPAPLEGFDALALYELSLGDLHQLEQPITLTFHYDPAKLKTVMPASDQIMGALYDSASGRWSLLPTTVDETAHTAVVQTDHLSTIALYMLAFRDDACITEHFVIAYDATEIKNVASSTPYTPSAVRCKEANHPAFILAIADLLELAYSGYVKEGFTFPVGRGRITVIAGVIPSFYGSDPQFDTLTGALILSAAMSNNITLLRHDCAHELFHYLQESDLGLAQYLINQWWMDATADYAADRVAWATSSLGATGQMGSEIRADFLSVSLESNTDYHAYSSAHLVDYLVNQSFAYKSFKDLWDTVKVEAVALRGIDLSLKSRIGEPFGEIYNDFAAKMLFDGASKLPLGDTVWGTEAVNDAITYQSGYGTIESTAVAPNFGSVLWAIRTDKPRFMNLEWTNITEGVVYVYFQTSEGRSGIPAYYQLYPLVQATFPLVPGETAYILMIDPTFGELDFNLRISESEVETYRINAAFDSSVDPKCAENSAWGAYPLKMQVNKGKVSITYLSATDDPWWSPNAEHSVTASGSGTLVDNNLVAGFESTDTITMGSGVKGKVFIQAKFDMRPADFAPFRWEGKSSGSAQVTLPKTDYSEAYNCTGTIRDISIFPSYEFSFVRK